MRERQEGERESRRKREEGEREEGERGGREREEEMHYLDRYLCVCEGLSTTWCVIESSVSW